MKWWGWGDEQKFYDLGHRPKLWPWIERKLQLTEPYLPEGAVASWGSLVERKSSPEFEALLRSKLRADQISGEDLERVKHAFGKSYRDLLRLRAGNVEVAPDLVIFPESHEEVEFILNVARVHRVVLIPFGGGTNIVGCVESRDQEQRVVASLDLTRMKRMLSLDKESRVAVFECGALGPAVEEQLRAEGFALAHTPDSFEYSSLGGWIATRSAGTHSNAYGKIEDMVVSLKVVTPSGTVKTALTPASSAGPDLNRIFAGSEGTLGVITEASMRVHPRPAVEEYRGVLFRNFEAGVAAVHATVKEGCLPALIRLSDEAETDLAFTMKPLAPKLKQLLQAPVKKFLTLSGYTKPCLLIVGFEGSEREVSRSRRDVLQIFREHGGFDLGCAPGKSWHKSRFDLPYLRDLLMHNNVMVDVSETATVWSNLLPLYARVQKAIADKLSEKSPGGYVGCHLSHIYETGASLYFTFAAKQWPKEELAQYIATKGAATAAIVEGGGTLSHHHAVGYEHQPWLKVEIGESGMRSLKAMKQALDPENILNPGNFFVGKN